MVHLDHGYVLDADKNCFMLGRVTTDKKGKQSFVAEAYYGTLDAALRGYKTRLVRKAIADTNGGVDALIGALKASDELMERVEGYLRDAGYELRSDRAARSKK